MSPEQALKILIGGLQQLPIPIVHPDSRILSQQHFNVPLQVLTEALAQLSEMKRVEASAAKAP